jgi:hypothetical protein
VTTLYIVMGSQGDYSDYSEWLVVAYNTADLAGWHALKANAEVRRLEAMDPDERAALASSSTLATPLDPVEGFELWGMYSRKYRVDEVELLEAVP